MFALAFVLATVGSAQVVTPAGCSGSGFLTGNGFYTNFFSYPYLDYNLHHDPAYYSTLYKTYPYLGSSFGVTNLQVDIVDPNLFDTPQDIYNFQIIPQNFSVELLGYYFAPQTGVYQFSSSNIDNALNFRLGLVPGSDCSGPTTADMVSMDGEYYEIYEGGNTPTGTGTSSFYLEAGKYYPIRILELNTDRDLHFNMVASLPDGSQQRNVFGNIWQFGPPPTVTSSVTTGYLGTEASTTTGTSVTTYTSNFLTTTGIVDVISVFTPYPGILTTETTTPDSVATTYTTTGLTTFTSGSEVLTRYDTVVVIVPTPLPTLTTGGTAPTTYTTTSNSDSVSGSVTYTVPVTEVVIVTTPISTVTTLGPAPTTYTTTGLTTFTSGSETYTSSVTEAVVVTTLPTVTVNGPTPTTYTTGTMTTITSGSETYTTSVTEAVVVTTLPTVTITGSAPTTYTTAGLTTITSGSEIYTTTATEAVVVVTPTPPITVTSTGSSLSTYTTTGLTTFTSGSQTYTEPLTEVVVVVTPSLPITVTSIGPDPSTYTTTESTTFTSGSQTYTTSLTEVVVVVTSPPIPTVTSTGSKPSTYTTAGLTTITSGSQTYTESLTEVVIVVTPSALTSGRFRNITTEDSPAQSSSTQGYPISTTSSPTADTSVFTTSYTTDNLIVTVTDTVLCFGSSPEYTSFSTLSGKPAVAGTSTSPINTAPAIVGTSAAGIAPQSEGGSPVIANKAGSGNFLSDIQRFVGFLAVLFL